MCWMCVRECERMCISSYRTPVVTAFAQVLVFVHNAHLSC